MILTSPEPFVTATKLKDKLKKSAAEPDDAYLPYVETACGMIRDRMGEISPVQAEDVIEPTHRSVFLEHTPVIRVISATDNRTGLAIPADQWRLVTVEGHVRHSSRWPTSVTFEYEAGRDPIPPNYEMAALDLAAYLWRQSQQNSAGGRPPVSAGDQPSQNMSWALPYSVRQMLGLDKRPRREVWLG